ncbi:hypothetical protein TPENAI_50177 [Tenacibaculum litopenaei]|uniref:ligand-binding sensor domain-containing protein n=1 Tax=Tenacibaculum litopenaei TaxID=396016 RepID=UPI003892F3FF
MSYNFHINIKNSHSFFGCFLLILLCTNVWAQKSITPEWLTIENGLSQGFISAMHQDANGFLWFGTKAGLNRYDGRHFKHFRDSNIDITNLQNEQIRSITGSTDFLLIGTEGDLYLYLPKYDSFYPFKLKFGIGDIFKVDDTTFWVADTALGLHKLSLTQKGNLIGENAISSFSIEKLIGASVNPYFKLRPFKNTMVLFRQVGDHKELQLFNVSNEQFQALPPLFEYPIPSEMKIGYAVLENCIIAYTDSAIYLWKASRWQKIPIPYKINNALGLPKAKKLLLSTNDRYLLFDITSVQTGQFQPQQAEHSILTPKTGFYNVLEDNSGNIWIGTTGYGIMKLNQRKMAIQHHFEGVSIYAKPFVSQSGTVFIYNPMNESKLIVPGNNKREVQKIKSFAKNHRELLFLQNTTNNELWSATITPTLIELYRESATGFTPFLKIPIDFQYHIRLFAFTPDHQELVLALGTKIIVINMLQKKWIQYDHGLAYDWLCLTLSSPSTIWLGADQGLLAIQRNQQTFTHKVYTRKNTVLTNNKISAIHRDTNSPTQLWIGTKGGGLYNFDTEKESFTKINTTPEFPDATIYGILEDTENFLWLSSNNGLIRYDKVTQQYKHFTKNDGLQGNEFNTFAYAQNKKGQLYFGGTNGLNSFHPKDVKDNTTLPKAMITDIAINNIKLHDSIAPEYLQNLQLEYRENSLSFSFAATEYTAPFKNTFSYYLEGSEQPWVHTTTDNRANYLNIAPGVYHLKLKTANSDGLWNEHFTSLAINIRPPWYQTYWAYGLYLLLMGTSVISIVKIREQRINNKREKEKIQLENQLLESKIANKQKDLVDLANSITENIKWRDYLIQNLKKIQGAKGQTKNKYYNELINEIKTKTSIENNRVAYQQKIDVLNNEFYDNLLEKYPKLSKNELKLCSLIKLDFTSKEIAMIQGIEVRSVYISRSRLRKKMKLSPEVDLVALLKKIS